MTALAARLGHVLKAGDCLAFYGDLGAGKSSFARALIQGVAGNVDVPSPTFTLVQHYDTKQGPLHHFDLYRVKDPQEIYELGWEETLSGIVLVEWPDRLGNMLPAGALAIMLDFPQHQPDSSRTLTLKGNAAWATRLAFLQD